MPTKTQVLDARPQVLLDMVSGWGPFMATEEQTAQTYRGYVERPGGRPWEGDTADAAIGVARDHHVRVADARDTVDAGVRTIGNTISTELIPALTNAQQIIANADTQPGVTVDEDLTITYTPPEGMSEAAVDRNRQIVADAAKELQESANQWWAAEQQVASQIATLRGKLDGTIPEGGAPSPAPPLTMVGPFALPPDVAAAAAKAPGQTIPGDSAPPAQIGPFPVPAAVAAAAGDVPVTAPVSKQGDDGGLGDLLGVNDSGAGVAAVGQPGGLPAALGQLPPPPDPSAVPRQAAKVEAARQTLNSAQTQLDDAALQAYTQGPGTSDRDVTHQLSQAVFDARAELTEQTRTLNELNYASAASGGPTAPVSVLPPNADVQAFPPEPSPFAEGSRALSEGSFGLIPDVAKDLHTLTNWDQASGADRLQAGLDAAGLLPIPGAKLGTEGLEHGLDALGAATRHVDDLPTPYGDVPAGGHGPVPDTPVEHHGSPDTPIEHSVPEPVGQVDPGPVHQQLTPDTFSPDATPTYASGDPHHPGGWPPGTPDPTWTKGDTDPGWKHVNHNFDKDWMPYQQQVGGVERTPDGALPEWVQPDPDTGAPVDFDGHTHRGPQEVFLEAKDGFRGLAFAPDNTYWEGRAEKALNQVERQLAAVPPGAMLEWHVSDPYGAAALRKLFSDQGVDGVDVIFTPKVP